MKNPASSALFMFRVLLRDPNAGIEMGSSILLRVSVSSAWSASAIRRAVWLRKKS